MLCPKCGAYWQCDCNAFQLAELQDMPAEGVHAHQTIRPSQTEPSFWFAPMSPLAAVGGYRFPDGSELDFDAQGNITRETGGMATLYADHLPNREAIREMLGLEP